ncbi:DUF1552 domain-containing protein [Rhodopirellula sp. JC740]|uniref:DUF1552 domain-containing protein n=1 Tax=Rhodopirellula halodulae TaxID=2894198 RepID=A0ABS8NG41_9BACT|nr:DUF1552 domain-containing protein [Rhodopirellula sp. JC740]MCC9641818.1 DUF1552 domain-containing protein [Rhodopirellula sp. JC740]
MSSFSRRNALRAAGISIGLPTFASLPKRSVGASETGASIGDGPKTQKRRLVCIGNMLGFYPGAFWPSNSSEDAGPDANRVSKGLMERATIPFGQSSQSLSQISNQLTLVSGLDHGLKGGHFAIHAFLSGVRQVDAHTMPMANITVDQFAAQSIPGVTRFPTLTIGSESGIHGGCQLSWTRSGTRVPPIPGPQQLFETLFVGTDPKKKQAAAEQIGLQNSILDVVLGNAKDLKRQLNSQDQQKLEEYLTSVRDVEQRLKLRRNWIDVPKPKAPFAAPRNRNMVEDLPLLYDLIVLALQTDSTRIATLEIGGDFNPNDLGIQGGYHALSHHGQRQENIDKLIAIESYQVEQYVRFIQKLDETSDENGSLLDQTAVLFGSGMGNANSHTNSNLPIVVAGGGGRHGRWLDFDERASDRPPLSNLFVSMLQDFGVETDQFANSTGTLRGWA